MSFYQYYNNIPVLNYHKVSDSKEIGRNVVSTESFKEQMSYLHEEGYQTIHTNDYDSCSCEKPIIITFDDAYTEIYENCFQIMESFSFKGLIFPIVNFIGKLNTWDANLAGITFKHMNKESLIELSEAGWEIGSHSLNHISFLHAKNLKEEIFDSRKALEDITGKEVNTFSYPFGRVSKTAKLMIERVYKYAFLAKMSRKNNELEISRASIYSNDTIKTFENKIKNKFKNLLIANLIHKGAVATEIYQLFYRNKIYKDTVK